jgi:dTDP-4-amino-4,6-dideoxygalactose transaminase
VALSGAYEGRLRRHFPGTEPPVDGLDLPLLSLRMDEIRAALLRAELTRLPQRLALFHRNYAQVSGALADLPGIAIRNPVAPGAYLGEAFVFRVPGGDAGWFTRALRAEGIDARNIGADDDLNVRAFWNWRFMYDDRDPARIRATLPRTARLLAETVDVPLSSSLTPDDCDQLIRAVRKVAAAAGTPGDAAPDGSLPAAVGVEPVRA